MITKPNIPINLKMTKRNNILEGGKMIRKMMNKVKVHLFLFKVL